MLFLLKANHYCIYNYSSELLWLYFYSMFGLISLHMLPFFVIEMSGAPLSVFCTLCLLSVCTACYISNCPIGGKRAVQDIPTRQVSTFPILLLIKLNPNVARKFIWKQTNPGKKDEACYYGKIISDEVVWLIRSGISQYVSASDYIFCNLWKNVRLYFLYVYCLV